MAAGDTMQGRRRPEEDYLELEAGDYTVRGGVAWVCLPSGSGPVKLEGWELTEHDDGTITVHPSVHDVSAPGGWHGWLRNGVWSVA